MYQKPSAPISTTAFPLEYLAKEQTYDSPWCPYTTIPDEYNKENKRSSHALKTVSEYAKLVRIVHKNILLRWLLPLS